MEGVLNEVTRTVHEHERGKSDFQTTCGSVSHVSHDQLRIIPVERTIDTGDASKCGRCFDDGGGY